jgi:hypothetical protein
MSTQQASARNYLIQEAKLWDNIGNYCRIELFRIGDNTFELYTHDFNDSVPGRFVGGLGECVARGDRWMARQKSEGFCEQLPSYNPFGTRES